MMYNPPMVSMLSGFGDELEKLATKKLSLYEKQQRKFERDLNRVTVRESKNPPMIERLRGESSPRQRDYLASALIAAAAYPTVRVSTSVIGRALRNKSLRSAMSGAGRRSRRALSRRLESGPLISTHASGKNSLVTKEGLMTDAARGLIVGSALQAVRDRLSGSTPVK